MSLYTIVDYVKRPKLLQWLSEKTSIKMTSGEELWPFEDIQNIKRDTVIRATSKGISIEWPLNNKIVGKRFEARDFCKLVLQKFPPVREWKQKELLKDG